MNKMNRLIRYVLSLVLALVMVSAPVMSSYAVMITSNSGDDLTIAEDEAGAVTDVSEDSRELIETEQYDPASDSPDEQISGEEESDMESADLDSEPDTETSVDAVEQEEAQMTEDDQKDEKSEEEEPESESESVRTDYVYQGNGVKVSAVLDDPEAVPDDATLIATPITNDSGAYNAYMDALNRGSDSSYDESNTLLYDIAFVKDGVELQPTTGNVSVTFEFLDSQLSESLGAQNASDVSVIHLPLADAVKGQYDTTADASDISADDIIVEEVTKAENGLSVSVQSEEVFFETNSFSVFAYTVDFEYTDPETGKVYTYNLDGAGSITLKELVVILGITSKEKVDDFIDNVEYVKFSNEDLVKVEKTLLKGWVLKSLAPFSSEELLTIIMKDGTVIQVKVTDAQTTPTSSDLSNFLSNAEISAPKDENGKYLIVPDETYLIDLSFVESSTTFQFPNDGSEMTYRLPDGLELVDHSGTFPIKVRDGGQTYTVNGNTYSVQNGVLTVLFATDDPNFSRLAAASNLQFGIEMEGGFSENIEVIEFNDQVIKELVVDYSSEVTASKSATVDTDNDKVNYTVSIVSKGRSNNIVVKDTISDPEGVLSLDANSIRATSSTGQPVSMTGEATGNSFTYTISEMKNGEIITFTYSADIDVSKIPSENGRYVVVGNNKIQVNSDEDPDPFTRNVDSVIDYTPSIKKDGSVVGLDGKTLTWTIIANEAAKVSMAGGTITDTIRESSRQYMTYSGDGITVKVYKADGTYVETRNIAWNELEEKTDSTWTYRVPESDSDKAYKYVITYTTEVDTTGATTIVTVENDVHTEHKDDHGSSDVTPIGGEVKLYKKGTDVDLENKEITWDISFTVPEAGLTKAEVTDRYPFASVDGVNTYEAYKENTVDVTGLVDGEEYEVVIDSVAKAVKIIFYRNSNRTPGLNPGQQRTIHVTLKTEINQDWLEAAKEDDYLKKHTNTVWLNDVITATDTVIVAEPTVDKTATVCGTRKVGNTELPIYRYEITLTDIRQDDNIIVDAFDRDLLEPYTPSSTDTWSDTVYAINDIWYVYGGTINWQGNKGASPVTYIDTTDGIKINTTASSMPHNGTGYYDKYKIVYCLTVKDAAAMNKIMRLAASADDGKYKIKNKVTWNDEWDGAEIVYEYPGLTKELLNPEDLHQEDEDIWVNFRITANSGAQMLNGGQPLELTDTVENLSIDITSVKVEKEENGALTDITANVPHDMSGDTMTYQIPDSTKIIITYRARVTFPELHHGDNKIEFRNNVKMLGYEKEVHDEGWRTNVAEGTATVYAISLMKYQGGNLNKRLKGAVFALLDSNKNPVVDKNDNEVQYTTDDDGIITVRGDQEQDGWTLQPDTKYYLREIKAPPGFMLLNNDYEFTISKDDSTDYTHYIYHNGDTMSAKNYRGTDVFVEKKWSDGYDNHESDTVTVKLQQKIGSGEWSDTIRWQNKNNNYAWEDVQKSIVLNKDNDWKGSFRSLPLDVPVGDIGEGFDEDTAEFETVQYRIVETKINNYDITYDSDGNRTDQAPYDISVSEVDGDQIVDEEGNVVTIQSYNYTIENTPIEEKGSLKISKTVTENGGNPSADAIVILKGTYTFTLYLDEECTTPYTVDGEAKTVTLTVPDSGAAVTSDEVTDLPAGDYWIKETSPTNGSSPVNNPVKVTVEAGKTGEAAVIAEFTNNLATTEGEVKVKKTLSGRDWTTDDSFEFTITPKGDAPAFDPNTVTITKDDEGYTESFGKVKFTKEGTYQWTVTETHKGETIKGVTYDSKDKTVTIVVTKNEDGELVADTGSALIQTAEFTNEYDASGKATLNAKKAGNDTLGERTFTFQLLDENGEVIETSDPVKQGETAAFTEIKYDLDDVNKEYTYKIREVIPAGATEENDYTFEGVKYDSHVETVTVKVTDNGDGTLAVTYDGKETFTTPEFKNNYAAKGDGEVKVKKTLSGREWTTNDSFRFTITPVGNAPAFDPNTATVTKDSADYTESFGKVEFTKARTYKWTVTEEHQGQIIDGVKYDSEPKTVTIVVKDDGKGNLIAEDGSNLVQTAEFTNTYSKSGEGEIKVLKNLVGREWTTDDSFEFTITPVGNAPAFVPNTATVTKDSESYTESFGKVKFTEVGTYQWKVSETHKGETIDGVAYDSADKTVTIVVKDDGKGHLIADEGSNLVQTAEFTNTYTKSGEGEIKVLKNLIGRDWTTDDSFKFTITPVGNAPETETDEVTVTKDSASYTESFGKVKFTEDGTYQWTVTEEHQGETINGIKYDSEPKTVTIVVKDDGKGNLVAEDGSALVQTAAFENNYSAKGEGEVKVKKAFSGRDWTSEDSFRFTITSVGNAPAFVPNTATVTKDSEDYTESFGKVEFTKTGTYQWTVSEEHQGATINGITYASEPKTVTIVVKDDGKGNLIADDGSALIQTAEFKNTYDAKGKAILSAKKAGNATLGDRKFTFQLLDENDALIETSDPVKQGETATFTELEYGLKDAGKEYTYKIREVIPAGATEENDYTLDGVKYDSHVETVIVKITDKGDGTLEVAYNGNATFATPEFKNSYAAKGEGEVKVRKTLNGREWTTDDSFEFTITPVGSAPAFDLNTATVTKDSADYTESFGKVEFTKAGTYQWTVSETHKGETIDGVAYDSSDKTVTIVVKDDGKGHLIAEEGSDLVQTAAFTNTYTKSGEGEVKVLKNLIGRDWTSEDSFEFTIKPVGNAPEFKPNKVTVTKDSESYTESFGKVKFAKAGTYKWTVTETHKGKTIDGVKYDSEPKTVTIVVEDDGKGNLFAKDGSALVQTAEFRNTYSAKGKGEIKVQKVLEGRDWTNSDTFTFTITGKNGAPMPEVGSISITKSDRKHIKSFGEIRFSKAGTYTYIVKESKGSLGGVTYDETEHEVAIKVADNGKGKLVAAEGTKLVQTEVFTNAYRAKEAKGEIKVQKLLQGRAWNDSDQFTFTLSADKGTPMPAETTITIRKSDADNIRSFGEIKFKKAGKYTYTVRETKGNIKGVNYDTKAHKVTIEVVDDGNGHLIAKEGTSLIQTVKITNTTGVKTGDENQILLPMAGMFASMLALLLIVIRRRKSRA